MTKDIHLVDPDIHAMIQESLTATGLRLSDSPEGVSALVTEDRDIDEKTETQSGVHLEMTDCLGRRRHYILRLKRSRRDA